MKLDGTVNSALMGLKAGRGSAPGESRSKEPAQEFEALLIRKVVEAMRKTVPEGSLGASGRQMHDYLVEEALTQALKDGGGMGMSRMFEPHATPQKPGGLAGAVRSAERGWGDVHPNLIEEPESLGRQLPPTRDAFLEGANPEAELQRLLLGGGTVGLNETQQPAIQSDTELLAANLPPSRDTWDHQGESAEATLLSILGEGKP